VKKVQSEKERGAARRAVFLIDFVFLISLTENERFPLSPGWTHIRY